MKGGGMVTKGFRFGLILQLAVGPVCLFIFQTAAARGYPAAEAGVCGVTLVDGLYILAAAAGIAAVLDKARLHIAMKLFGSVVLCVFGLSTILGQFGIRLLPGLALSSNTGAQGTFLYAILLTASNPLTILFWAGVFSGKVVELAMVKKDISLYGLGAMLSTLVFLSVVACVGSLAGAFLPDAAIAALNIMAGLLLIFFGVRMAPLSRKGKPPLPKTPEA